MHRSLSAPDLLNRNASFPRSLRPAPGVPVPPAGAPSPATPADPADPAVSAAPVPDWAARNDTAVHAPDADFAAGSSAAIPPMARTSGPLPPHQRKVFHQLEDAVLEGDYEKLQRQISTLSAEDLSAVIGGGEDRQPLLHTLLDAWPGAAHRTVRNAMLDLLLLWGPEATLARNGKGQIGLHLAARQADLEVLRKLLPHSPAVNALDRQQRSPLHLLAQYAADLPAFRDCVNLLKNHGADWTLVARNGHDAAGVCGAPEAANTIMGAVSYGKTQLERLRSHPDIDLKHIAIMDGAQVPRTRRSHIDGQRERLGRPSLYARHPAEVADQAAYHSEIVTRVAAGLNLHQQKRFTQLAEAIHKDDPDALRTLLQAMPAPEVSQILTFHNVDTPPLIHALLRGGQRPHAAQMLELLVQACPQAAGVTGELGQTALQVAAEEGHVWAYGPLLQQLRPEDVNRRDMLQRHPIFAHAQNAGLMDATTFERGARLLRQYGADIWLEVDRQVAAGACADRPAASNAILGLPAGTCLCLVEMQQNSSTLTPRDYSQQQMQGTRITRWDEIDLQLMLQAREPLYFAYPPNTEAREAFTRKYLAARI